MFLFDSILNINNSDYESLIVFSGQLEGDSEDYANMFEHEFQNYKPRPQIIFFIYPGYLKGKIQKYSERGSTFYDNIIRYGNDIPVILSSFNGYGKLTVENTIFCEELEIDVSNFEKNMISDGVLALAKNHKNDVILRAPSGTVFVKPSTKKLDEFIQASGLAVGYSENQFIAFALLTYRPSDKNIKDIYIDTSGISGFVEALTYYLYRFSNDICKPVKYHSYNSYFGLDNVKPDVIDNIWVIISASNSNSMGKKIVKEWGVTGDQVVTVLSYTKPVDKNEGDSIVCNISSISDGYKNPDKFVPTVNVKVLGENFTAEVCEPNRVIIKAKHKTSAISKCIYPYKSSGFFKCMKTPVGGKSARSIYVDMSVLNNAEFTGWVENVISWYVPATLKWIVYNDADDAGKKLYEIVSKNLSSDNDIQLVSFNDAGTVIKGKGAVLVLSPVISDGKSLLRLNRNLRISGHTGNRIFMSPFVTSSSKSTFNNFKNSLIYGPGGLKYQFFSFYEIFIGHFDAKSSWVLERKVVENFKSNFWINRTEVLNREGEGLNGCLGTPSINVSDRLSFTQDFAFWGTDYIANEVNPEVVYVTVASVLQGLRDKNYTNEDKDSLYSHIYQHSVIDPENFTRFNDGLIQTCLWRAANASEVDYKSSEVLSDALSSILSRLIEEMGKSNPNSCLDLLMGIAVGKITLTKSILHDLISHGKDNLTEFDHAMELLNYIEAEYLV